tara:strand:- start:549 stop:1076 length:528 start_codon:yes stop_codon:yes gene_type:complete
MATLTANSIELSNGAKFVGTTNGLTDTPPGTIIQTAVQTSDNTITVNSDGSYTDVMSVTFTPRQSNSKIILSLMFTSYTLNSSTSNGTAYRILRDSTAIKVANWNFYLNDGGYTYDFYPVTNIIDVDEPGTTSAITYKLQGRKYNGNSSFFATQFGESQGGSGNRLVWKIEELSV